MRDTWRPCPVSPVCDTETIQGEERYVSDTSSCFLIITDALISNCDQLNDCLNLEINGCLDFFFFRVVKSLSLQHAVKNPFFVKGDFLVFCLFLFTVTTGLLYCADSTHEHQRRGLHHICHFLCLVSDQLELSSDCNADVPLPFSSLSVYLFDMTRSGFILEGVTFFLYSQNVALCALI